MNIKQIKEKLNTLPLNTDSQVQALVYAIVTLFDLDDDSRVFRSKWYVQYKKQNIKFP